ECSKTDQIRRIYRLTSRRFPPLLNTNESVRITGEEREAVDDTAEQADGLRRCADELHGRRRRAVPQRLRSGGRYGAARPDRQQDSGDADPGRAAGLPPRRQGWLSA